MIFDSAFNLRYIVFELYHTYQLLVHVQTHGQSNELYVPFLVVCLLFFALYWQNFLLVIERQFIWLN